MRMRWITVILLSTIMLGVAVVVGALTWSRYQARANAPSAADVAGDASWASGDRIVFRNTASGKGYGLVSSVRLDDVSGPRAVTHIPCDRVDATASEFSCLHIVRGIAPTFTGAIYANDGAELETWPLAGVPSRTRISDDGTLVATTAFVTGHSYASIGFSTETVIRRTDDGDDFGNFEDWALVIDGKTSAPVDRNYWGVTFVDDNTFYATVGMTVTGETHLVRGDIRARKLTALADNVQCPSLSPDGTRIAFKRVTSGSGPTVHWTPAIYDLASGKITLLPESRSIDDQIEWLDDDTILYGMPRTEAGDSDVWAMSADGSTDPRVLIEHAWSPSVVRVAATGDAQNGDAP